jgi:hypothetical protein
LSQILDWYKEERAKGYDHYSAQRSCLYMMVGAIQAKVDRDWLQVKEEFSTIKPDYKKIVGEIDALIKEFNGLDGLQKREGNEN